MSTQQLSGELFVLGRQFGQAEIARDIAREIKTSSRARTLIDGKDPMQTVAFNQGRQWAHENPHAVPEQGGM